MSTRQKNMGIIDRGIRTSLAFLIGILYLAGQISGVAAIILGVFAVAFLITSSISFCPVYLPLKISTRKKEETG